MRPVIGTVGGDKNQKITHYPKSDAAVLFSAVGGHQKTVSESSVVLNPDDSGIRYSIKQMLRT